LKEDTKEDTLIFWQMDMNQNIASLRISIRTNIKLLLIVSRTVKSAFPYVSDSNDRASFRQWLAPLICVFEKYLHSSISDCDAGLAIWLGGKLFRVSFERVKNRSVTEGTRAQRTE